MCLTRKHIFDDGNASKSHAFKSIFYLQTSAARLLSFWVRLSEKIAKCASELVFSSRSRGGGGGVLIKSPILRELLTGGEGGVINIRPSRFFHTV